MDPSAPSPDAVPPPPAGAGAVADAAAAGAGAGEGAPAKGWWFTDRQTFWWKSGLLLATTLALVPILLWKHELAAKVYLWVLVVVHVAGIFVVGAGVRRHQIAPDRRGFLSRVAAIVCLVGLLYLASQGLNTKVGGTVFWVSLFAIWALHTLGLVLLHVRSNREQALCPFA